MESQSNSFQALGVNAHILQALKELKIEEPTPIQAQSIPPILAGKDVIAQSATGSGKTLAFAVGIIHHTERGKGIQNLVVTPTRELAEQIAKHLRHFSKHAPLKIALVYGGVAFDPQAHQLKTADVVVATPGRLLDHLQRGNNFLRSVKTLVLDEADRMFEMGFIDDIKKIIQCCPRERQTLFFSATFSSDLRKLAHAFLREPVSFSVSSYVDPSKLHQVYYDVDDKLKFSLLVHLLKHEKSELVMVFCNARQQVNFVADNLRENGVDAFPIHGGLSQQKRNHLLEQFHKRTVHVLVCTDVAARGLDIKNVSHVYNYDLPKDSKQYVHRIGRTARAGEKGIAVNILSSRDHDNFYRVQRDNSKMKITKLETPHVERVFIKKRDSHSHFGGGGYHREDRRGSGRPGPHRGRYNSDFSDSHSRGSSHSSRSGYGYGSKHSKSGSSRSPQRRFFSV